MARARAGPQAGGRHASERLKPPQRQRKASQTARGFTCQTTEWLPAAWHPPAPDSPRRRTSRISSGEFIRSGRGFAPPGAESIHSGWDFAPPARDQFAPDRTSPLRHEINPLRTGLRRSSRRSFAPEATSPRSVSAVNMTANVAPALTTWQRNATPPGWRRGGHGACRSRRRTPGRSRRGARRRPGSRPGRRPRWRRRRSAPWRRGRIRPPRP